MVAYRQIGQRLLTRGSLSHTPALIGTHTAGSVKRSPSFDKFSQDSFGMWNTHLQIGIENADQQFTLLIWRREGFSSRAMLLLASISPLNCRSAGVPPGMRPSVCKMDTLMEIVLVLGREDALSYLLQLFMFVVLGNGNSNHRYKKYRPLFWT